MHCRIFCSIPGHWQVALPFCCDNQMSSGEQSVPVENLWQTVTGGKAEYIAINAGRWLDIVVGASDCFCFLTKIGTEVRVAMGEDVGVLRGQKVAESYQKEGK